MSAPLSENKMFYPMGMLLQKKGEENVPFIHKEANN
jgi:hypothetical protein